MIGGGREEKILWGPIQAKNMEAFIQKSRISRQQQQNVKANAGFSEHRAQCDCSGHTPMKRTWLLFPCSHFSLLFPFLAFIESKCQKNK
jgi:hypothetical protein